MADHTYAEAFAKALGYGFKRFFQRGPVSVERVGSWGSPAYPRFGAWWHHQHRGVTFRYRAYLLVLTWRPHRIKPVRAATKEAE